MDSRLFMQLVPMCSDSFELYSELRCDFFTAVAVPDEAEHFQFPWRQSAIKAPPWLPRWI